MNKDFTPEELLERIQRMYKHKKPEEQIIVLTESEYTRQVQTLVKAQVSVYESQGKLSSKGALQKKIYELEEQLARIKDLNKMLMGKINENKNNNAENGSTNTDAEQVA